MNSPIAGIIAICDRHADRLRWAMSALQLHLPFTGQSLAHFRMIIRMIMNYKLRF